MIKYVEDQKSSIFVSIAPNNLNWIIWLGFAWHEKGCRDKPGWINIIKVCIDSFFELQCFGAMLWFPVQRLSWWFSISFRKVLYVCSGKRKLGQLFTLYVISPRFIDNKLVTLAWQYTIKPWNIYFVLYQDWKSRANTFPMREIHFSLTRTRRFSYPSETKVNYLGRKSVKIISQDLSRNSPGKLLFHFSYPDNLLSKLT
jgi:hypothetical protein